MTPLARLLLMSVALLSAGVGEGDRAVLPVGVVSELAIAPDGRWVAANVAGQAIYVWAADTGRALRVLPSKAAVRGALASGDGHLLLAGRGQNEIVAWELPIGSVAHVFPGVTALATDRDGRRVLVADEQGRQVVWSLEGPTRARRWRSVPAPPSPPADTEAGTLRATVFSGDLRSIAEWRSRLSSESEISVARSSRFRDDALTYRAAERFKSRFHGACDRSLTHGSCAAVQELATVHPCDGRAVRAARRQRSTYRSWRLQSRMRRFAEGR
jgi:hypothetical protein